MRWRSRTIEAIERPIRVAAAAFAMVGVAALTAPPASSWGSINNFVNAHRCVDETAYNFIQLDPAFAAAEFPTVDGVDANEGISLPITSPVDWEAARRDGYERHANGPGPDSVGATFDSWHYYNPRTGMGNAPRATGLFFGQLARRQDAAKSAAWAAHFLADVAVPYHVNGMSASDLAGEVGARRQQLAPAESRFLLDESVTGPRRILSAPYPDPALGVPGLFSLGGSADFDREVRRFFADGGGAGVHDWFDPWYWNGVWPAATGVSSHLVWEGQVPNCLVESLFQVERYSQLWPGNPDPTFDDPIERMRQTVEVFVIENAHDTETDLEHYERSSTDGLLKATASVATMWRASFSALHIDLTYETDPKSLSFDSPAPQVVVRGKVGNFSDQIAGDVQVRLTVGDEQACKIVEGDAIQSNKATPPGYHAVGVWRLEALGSSACEVKAAVIGAFATPDLQYAETTRKIEIGAKKQSPPKLYVGLTPNPPAPGATVEAEAVLAPPPARSAVLEYEWDCDGCKLVAQNRSRATIQAPASGRATVTAKTRIGQSRLPLAEGEQTFTVKTRPESDRRDERNAGPTDAQGASPAPPIPAPATTVAVEQSPVASPTSSATPVPSAVTPPSTPMAKTPVIPIDDADASSVWDWTTDKWSDGLQTKRHDQGVALAPDVSAKTKALAAQKVADLDKRLRAKWIEAKDTLTGLPAFIDAYLSALNSIYAGFRASAPATPDANGAATVTDLEGEGQGPCGDDIAFALLSKSTQAKDFKEVVLKALPLFANDYGNDDAYAVEMQAYDNVWGGQDVFTPKWRRDGLRIPEPNPCDNNRTTTLVLAPSASNSALNAISTPVAENARPMSVVLNVDPIGARSDAIAVAATVAGGKPPYAYLWTGARSSAQAHALYDVPHPGDDKARAYVQVKDSLGATVVGALALAPPKVAITLIRTSPAGGDIRVGERVTFAAKLFVDGKPTSAADYVLRWEPSTEARFDRPEGVNATDNAATFSRPGKTKVWVVALRRFGGVLAPAAESDPVELEILGAQISLKVEPPDSLIGQEVRVTASEASDVSTEDAAYWWEYSGAALFAGPTADPRGYSLIPKDGKPIVVTAHLKEKLHGDDLGAKSVTLTARAYDVSIVDLGQAWENSTQRPMIWVPGHGIAVLDKQIVAGQDVRLRVDVKPEQAVEPLRYRWWAGAGARITGNDATRETRAQRPDVGDIVANVEVRDARDIVLGAGSRSIAVTIDAAALADGKAKADALAKFKAEAAAAWAGGDLDAACEKGKAAAAIDPAFAATAAGYCDGRTRVLALAADAGGALAKPAVDRPEIDKAQSDYDQAQSINAKAKPLVDLARKIADARAAVEKATATLGEADQAWRSGDADAALQKASDALADAPKLPAAQQAAKRYAEALVALEAARTKAKTALERRDVDGALAAIADGKKTLVNDKPLLELEQAAQKAKANDSQCRQTASDGLAKQQAGDASGALALYRQALAACPQLCAALANSAAAYDASGDKSAAKQAATDALRCDPSDKDIRSVAARYGVAPPPPTDMKDPGPYCHELEVAAVALHKGGDPKGAIPLYQRSLALCPKLCVAMSDLGVALEQTGDVANGKSYLAAALNCDPTNKTIQAATVKYGVSAPAPNVTPEPLPPSTSGAGTWTYFAVDDCAGHDVGRSDGAAPSPEMCRSGVDTAVCWDGKTYLNKDKAGAWCTYKNVRAEACDEHAPNPARMYACSSATAGPASKTPAPSAPTPQVTPARPEPIEGLWDTTIVGSVHVQLDIRRNGGAWSVRFFGRDGWETMADVRIDPASATLTFRRPQAQFGEPDQIYSAKIADGVMRGQFNGGYGWEGRLVAGSASTPTPASSPATPTTDDKSCDGLLSAGRERWAQADGPGAVALYKKAIALCPLRCDLMNELSGIYHALGDAAASRAWFDATKACGEGKAPAVDQTPTSTPASTASPKGKEAATQSCRDMDFDAAMRWTAQDRNGSIEEEKKVVALCPDFCEAIKTLSWSYHLAGDEAESQRWAKAEAQCRAQNAGPTSASTTPSPKPTAPATAAKDDAEACEAAEQAANAKALRGDYQGAIDALRTAIGRCGARGCADMHQIGVWFYTIDKPDDAKRWLDDGHKCDPNVAANIGSFNAGPVSSPAATPSPKPSPSPTARPTPSASSTAPPTPRPSKSGADSCQGMVDLGVAAEKQGDLAGATDLLKKAIGACPQRCDAIDELVSILRKRGDAAAAQAMAKASRTCWDHP